MNSQGHEPQGAQIELVEVISPEQLAAISGFRSLRLFMARKQLRLRIPSPHAAMQQATERRLNFWLGVCGCKVGGVLFLAAVMWQLYAQRQDDAPALMAILHASWQVLAAAIAGKMAAILLARAAFMVDIALFQHRVNPT